MPIIFKAMSPSILIGPQPPGPPISLTVTGTTSTTVSLSWTAPVGGATTYNLYKNGVKVQIGIVPTSVVASGLTPSTLYQFYVTGQNPVGEGTQSNTVNAITSASGGLMKFNGGHYGGTISNIFAGDTVSRVSGQINAIVPYDRVLGALVTISWGALEPIKGELDVTATYPQGFATGAALLRSIYDFCAGRSTPKRFVPKIQLGSYTSTHPGSTDYSVIPQYIQTNSIYGASGYRVGGVVTNTPAQHGWWGGDGNGNTYAACFHRSLIRDRLILMLQVFGDYFDSLPLWEGVNFDENSFVIGASSTNACPDYSQTNFNNNEKTFLSSIVTHWPTTSVMWENSFDGTSTASQSLTDYMMDNRIDWSTTDVLGLTYSNAHSGNPYSWGAQTMIGVVPGGGTLPPTDYRNQNYALFPETQITDMGAFSQFGGGYTKEDILAAHQQILKSKKAFWGIALAGGSYGALKPNSTWDFMGPFLNNPSNALLNTSRPVNYT